MDPEIIDIGSAPNDGTGDSPRAGAVKINENFSRLFRRFFPTRADATAATIPEEVVVVHLDGWSKPGDSPRFRYVKTLNVDGVTRDGSVEPTHAGKFRSADGAWWELVAAEAVRPEWFGAIDTNGVPVTSELQDAIDFVCRDPNNQNFLSSEGLQLWLDGKVVVGKESHSTDNFVWRLVGGQIHMLSDDLVLDLSAEYTHDYSHQESVQNVVIDGGEWWNSSGAKTKATAMRCLGGRVVHLHPQRLRGWDVAIIAGGKDTITIGGDRPIKAYDNNTVVQIPPHSPIGAVLVFNVKGIHASHFAPTPALDFKQHPTDGRIEDFSLNLGSDWAGVGVQVQRTANIPITVDSGTPGVGETMTGGTSGATGTVFEVYEYKHAFERATAYTWIRLSDRSVATFQAGESVSFSGGGATGTVGSPASIIAQNTVAQNFRIGGSIHNEAGSGASGGTVYAIENLENRGNGATYYDIDLGSNGVGGAGVVGLKLTNITGARVAVRAGQTPGNGTVLKLNSGCDRIKLLGHSFLAADAPIDLNGASRQALDLSDFDEEVSHIAAALTGFAPLDVTTDAGWVSVDMSSVWTSWRTVGDKPPRAYLLRIVLTAGSSGTASVCNVRIRNPSEAFTAEHHLDIEGRPNGTYHSFTVMVHADGNGDWEYRGANTGSPTTFKMYAHVLKAFF